MVFARLALGYVAGLWSLEAAHKIDVGASGTPHWCLSEPAEQSRDTDAPAGARRTFNSEVRHGAPDRPMLRVGCAQEDGDGLCTCTGRERGARATRADVRHHHS